MKGLINIILLVLCVLLVLPGLLLVAVFVLADMLCNYCLAIFEKEVQHV